ncbi:MAG: glycosyltransferase [Propionibacteriaceae bacterium]|nr:glycosyltransferase [Propionibacteriaceae bacterium]
MPKTLLFAPETFNFAEVTRCIEVARRLPEFRCVFAGFSERFASPIREAGFEYRPLTPVLSDVEGEMAMAFDQGRGLRHPFTVDMVRQRVVSERALIRELKAAAVVIGTTLSQLISARAERVPLFYVKPFAYSVPHMTQMRRTGFLPATTRTERALDRGVAWLFREVLAKAIPAPKAFRQVAEECGVQAPHSFVGFLGADTNLVASPPELIPDWCRLPHDYRAVGPVYAQLDVPIPEDIAQLRGQGRPVVLVAMGSSASRRLVLDVLCSAARADVEIISPSALYLSPTDRASLPGNVHITGWIPVHRLGTLVDVAISHGGEGTVQTSCANGWPFIGIPLQLEQRYNVTRCVEFGNARLVSRKRAGRVDWAQLISRLLADEAMREAATRMAQIFQGCDGPGTSAQIIRDELSTWA